MTIDREVNSVTARVPVATEQARSSSRSIYRLWRISAADTYDRTVVRALTASLADVVLIGAPEWNAAAGGNSAAAIGIALRMNQRGEHHRGFDLAMTALTACAGKGSAAACLVVAHIIRNLPGAGKAEARIATSWLLRAFQTARAETSDAEMSS